MRLFRSASLVLPLYLAACATAVTQDLSDQEVTEGGSAGSGTGGMAGSPTTSDGGKSGSSTGKAGSASNPFGGTATTAGTGSGGGAGASAGSASGGTAGKASGGSGGTSGGATSGGTSSGGNAGSSSGGSSAGTGGSGVVVGTGSCEGTPGFVLGAGNKYAAGAKVVATCNGGTPCTLAKPAGQNGKQYEFSCKDMYNCGGQDPATTNWAQPPWDLTKVCE
jgi:hypothetical protein